MVDAEVQGERGAARQLGYGSVGLFEVEILKEVVKEARVADNGSVTLEIMRWPCACVEF